MPFNRLPLIVPVLFGVCGEFITLRAAMDAEDPAPLFFPKETSVFISKKTETIIIFSKRCPFELKSIRR